MYSKVEYSSKLSLWCYENEIQKIMLEPFIQYLFIFAGVKTDEILM